MVIPDQYAYLRFLDAWEKRTATVPVEIVLAAVEFYLVSFSGGGGSSSPVFVVLFSVHIFCCG